MAKRVVSVKKKAKAPVTKAKAVVSRKASGPENKMAKQTSGKKKKIAPPSAALIVPALNTGSSKMGDSTLAPKAPPPPPSQGEPTPSTFIDRGLPVPDNYGMDRLVALVRDPQWIYCYWELNGSRLNDLRNERGQAFIESCAWVIRLYRLNENLAEDMEIEPSIGNWYIHVGCHGKYQVELALLSPTGEWITLCVSQIIETPREGPSDVIDDEWTMLPEEDEDALIGAALQLAEARKRGVSGFLGSSRMQSSFALASSGMMLGSSASGKPVAGSWAWSFVGASGRISSSGSGGMGWLVSPTGVQEPMLDRPGKERGGPNWNEQRNLPGGKQGKTQQANFNVKLPRVIQNIKPPAPTWPPPEVARVAPGRRGSAKSKTVNGAAK